MMTGPSWQWSDHLLSSFIAFCVWKKMQEEKKECERENNNVLKKKEVHCNKNQKVNPETRCLACLAPMTIGLITQVTLQQNTSKNDGLGFLTCLAPITMGMRHSGSQACVTSSITT
jgi:hypothetical protein